MSKVIDLGNLNPKKADPNKTFTYTVKFPEMYEEFNGRVTAECKHFEVENYERCVDKNARGDKFLSTFAIFKDCCLAIHGFVYTDEKGEKKEYTPEELCHISFSNAEAEGKNITGLIYCAIEDIVANIISNSDLNEDEAGN